MRKIIASILFLGICTGVFAQAVPFLNIPSDARTAAMGSTGIALEKGAFTIDDNMATSAMTHRTAAFGANFWSWAPSTSALKLINAGGYYHFGKFAVALGGRYCIEKPYDIISAVGKPLGTYQPSSFTLGAGFAYRIIDPLALGVTVRYVSANYSENTKAGTVAADINATFSKGGLRAAVGVANLGGKIKGSPLPAMAKVGAAYHIGGFQASAEVDYLFAGAIMAGIGAEYGFKDIAFIRAGFHYGDAQKAIPTYASVGLGVQYWGVRLDATWITASSVLGNSLGFSLSYSF